MSITCSPARARTPGRCARSHSGDRGLRDLLSCLEREESVERLGEAAVVLRGFASNLAAELVTGVENIAVAAPFRNMLTPGGYRMSVAMTNCGRAGWVTDRSGYRYDPVDPIAGRPWPAMPGLFRRLAGNAAAAGGVAGVGTDASLSKTYGPGTKLSLYRCREESGRARANVLR